jgi:hypothetical protein
MNHLKYIVLFILLGFISTAHAQGTIALNCTGTISAMNCAPATYQGVADKETGITL